MIRRTPSRRWFLKTSTALAALSPLSHVLTGTEPAEAAGPLVAYVGTFSSPLRDTLATQVDLPPGNGRGIHLFRVDRTTGALTPSGIVEMGTSPSCLVLNAAGTRLYSANETDRVGEDKQGTVSAFAIDRADGTLTLLNTVRSGGAGPTYVSVHPAGRFVLVANYFGGSVAVLPDPRRRPAGRRHRTSRWTRARSARPRRRNAPPGSFAFSGHDRTHAHMIQADPVRALRAARRPGSGQDLRLEVRREEGRADPERSACRLAAAGRRAAALPFPPEWPLALLHPGGRLDGRAVRLRRRGGRLTARQTVSTLPPGFAGSNFCSEILVSADGRFVYAGNRLHDSIGIFSVGSDGALTFVGEEWTRGDYPRSFNFDPTGRFLYCCNQRGGQHRRLPGGSCDRRPRVHRPLRPRRQPVHDRLPGPGVGHGAFHGAGRI